MENNIIKLRALEPEDIELLYTWENDTLLWKVSNTIAPFSKYTLKRYIENAHEDIFDTKQLRLMIVAKDQNKTIGCIDLFDFEPFHQRAGVGILIYEKEDRSKGYAKVALNVLINYCFNTLGLHQLYCNITEDNVASIELFTKAGFVQTGCKIDWLKYCNDWKNELTLQLIKE